ncbi:MAG TPA: class I SAM-dependent methyltransferase [Anaerolineales bacterium]|nr:class I SAM-dependent methyltransferase [Anaerolineales bacterium]
MMLREAKVWLQRARECHNPLILARGLRFERGRLGLLRFCVGLSSVESRTLLQEIETDHIFLAAVRGNLSRYTRYSPRAVDFMLVDNSGSVFFNEVTLYVIMRALRPETVVETGGTPGKSTAFILRAMQRNGCGHLHTIDLPPAAVRETQLPVHESYHEALPSGASSGWVVPHELKAPHTQLLGPSREHLPRVLQQLQTIDVFLHDSDHSYENMTWEFETAFPALRESGLLLSDDVRANGAFSDFCRARQLASLQVYNLGAARREPC